MPLTLSDTKKSGEDEITSHSITEIREPYRKHFREERIYPPLHTIHPTLNPPLPFMAHTGKEGSR